MKERRHILDLLPQEVQAELEARNQPAYRAKQVLEWVYRHGASSFDEMTNLPHPIRETLAESFVIHRSEIDHDDLAADGTRKLLLRWEDGATSECVLIPDDKRNTACISTQVGCPVGCVFCASGIGGLRRNLSSGEIVEQVLRIGSLCGADARLTNVVLMGLGEPLANYDATVKALTAINAEWGVNIGARKITVSTVGLPGQIRRLADEGLQITLAISLHAPTDELRQQLIPWAKRVSIRELTDAAADYFARTSREITLEYVLLSGVNDHVSHARHLVIVAKRMRSNVNLIRYNPVSGLPYKRPTSQSTHAFLSALRKAGVNAHIRRSRGLDIEGACGQLRRRFDNPEQNPLEVTKHEAI